MKTEELLLKIREQKPLVHHITNWVTIYDCAQAIRSIGALPVMAHAEEEAAEMTGISSALVLNIGTLTTPLLKSMHLSAKRANEKGIPVVLDAVGAGATPMRSEAVKDLLDNSKIDVLKGNAGEISSIAGLQAEVRGVESGTIQGDPRSAAKELAKKLGNTIVITGKEDFVCNQEKAYAVKAGHEMMGKVVGTGCMAASIIGAFCAVEKDYAFASAAALAVYGKAGEKAAAKTKRPMEFKHCLMDELNEIDGKGTTMEGVIVATD
ncbi:hydroxyethylthiazole kinase [Candidatus Micrarchaeota archaeon]|nr:hydroxyethylthiazole kinase [Candidatus Micrarchaeota archaeon]